MSEKLIVSWEDYNRTVEKLAIMIDESNYKPNILIGIMRGAAPMIDVLSRIFKLKCLKYYLPRVYVFLDKNDGLENIQEKYYSNLQNIINTKNFIKNKCLFYKENGLELIFKTINKLN